MVSSQPSGEETSTDLSIDLARDLVSDEEVEEEDEEPIVPIMKAEPPRKEKRSEEEEKKGTPFLTPQEIASIREEEKRKNSEANRKLSREQKSKLEDNAANEENARKQREDERRRKEEEERRKLEEEKRRQEEEKKRRIEEERLQQERRIAQEVREGRERYDRRSQDRLDTVGDSREDERRKKREEEERRRRKEEAARAEEEKKRKKSSDRRKEERAVVPDLVESSTPQSTSTPVRSSVKQEVYKKTGRATSEASGLYTGPRTLEPSISVEEEVELRNPRRQQADMPLVEEEEVEVGSAIERKRPMTKEDIQKMNLKKKTRKRTRKFEIDGVTVTTTTSKVIYRDEESETFYDEHYFRKQELRDLKLLQKQEQKRFEVERTTLMKNYDNDLSSMIDSQKKQVDKCEQQQHEELKVSSKRIRNEQEKELKGFRESLKQEVKLLKCEVELLPKDRRKEALKMRKDQLEREHVLRERGFVERLNESR